MTVANRLLMSTAVLALCVSAGAASAQQVALNNVDTSALETVVVTGTQFRADAAPAKASLDTMEPQTIINKSYIQDSVSNTADYTTILAIAPSMTGQDINGPGLSDGGVKNTLRGLSDGNFVMDYDGIPFGDTNGPSHHSESYFPGVTIGSIEVDRGPGNAGNIGPSTYGGTVKLYSEAMTANDHASVAATAGSWGTYMLNGNYQSGDVDLGGHNTRFLVNANYTGSSGYLTYQNTQRQNYLIKAQTEIAPDWTLTVFANYNGLFQHVNDNAGETAAQVNAYGKTYALQVVDPEMGSYKSYNPEGKKTDMDYMRLQGRVGDFSIDDTAYMYAYVNKTVSATDITQTASDIAKLTTESIGKVTVNGVLFNDDVPGYTKQNAYRVYGNILRVSDDFAFGGLTGQVRAGVWWEGSSSQRQRKDFDISRCVMNNCDPWHDNNVYSDSSLSAAALGASKAKSAFLQDGYYEYREHSDWNQYQPFLEIELHPMEGLTLTPGVKYVEWHRSVSAPLEQKTVPVVPYYGSFATTHTLPFFEANYKIEPSWSVYAQYAQGIYVPDISAFENATPLLTSQAPKAQTTTNYQAGTVYYADNWTFDGDYYYIGVDNNISFSACAAPNQAETCAVNTGHAVYKGLEGQGTYAFDGDLEGFSIFASGSWNYTKTGGQNGITLAAVKNAPFWTEATGFIYKSGPLKLSIIDKLVGQQYVGKQTIADSLAPFYKLGAYNNMDFKASYTVGMLEFGMSISNVLNQRNLMAVTVNDKAAVGNNIYDVASRGTSLDQYFYAPSRGAQISLTAHF